MTHDFAEKRPTTREELAGWVFAACGISLLPQETCRGHCAPLDYLCHSFFEESPADCVVWACRGGGKTTMGAIATLLDMLFKPGIQIRILAGSLEQADRMFSYLRGFINEKFSAHLAGPSQRRSIRFKNKSRVEVLAQSEKSVRGTRVHKIRCDEVELFTRDIWQAAQLVTRSRRKKDHEGRDEGPQIRAAVEAFSTMHVPGGLMSEIIAQARAAGKKVFTWCAWDVIQQCLHRSCDGCSLHDGCAGRARSAKGFLLVEDLEAMRSRISKNVWENEVCCKPAPLSDAVFSGFSREKHLRALGNPTPIGQTLVAGIDFGYAGAFAAVALAIQGSGQRARVHVWKEYVRPRATLAQNILAIKDTFGALWPAMLHVDPAGVAINPHTGHSDIRQLRNAGFRVRYRRLPIETGLELIERLLCPALGESRLTIDPSCTHLIAALENYRWHAAQTGKPEKDGIHDHIIDALRYALTGELLPGPKAEFSRYA